ncbi:MAG: pseudouridylate synthase [Cyclobacteriaceae bacterium]|nr:pseudouridylate synthase [Cyclobacteriaceae bacterium]
MDLVAVNKPHGLLVHRSKMAADADIFALQVLRDQLQRHVYPVHRIDRKTGGVLLFSLDEALHISMQQAFANKQIDKKYLAIVRGFTDDSGTIDYPLKKENGHMQEAVTRYHTLDRSELKIPFGGHMTSRYSLLELKPETGRFHQIRRHLDHIRHPIIGCRPEGCNKQNKMFKEKFGLMTMMLHAKELRFCHPVSVAQVTIVANIQEEFRRMLATLQFDFNPD